jgi:hypothetical protein
MKKTLMTVIILLLAASAISYAGIFKQPENETSGTTSTLLENLNSNNGESSPTNSGGFFRSGDPDDPGGRPGDGGGIGQDTPLGDELPFLFFCSIAFGPLVFFRENRKKIENQ